MMEIYLYASLGFAVFLVVLFMPWGRLLNRQGSRVEDESDELFQDFPAMHGEKVRYRKGMTLEELSHIWRSPDSDIMMGAVGNLEISPLQLTLVDEGDDKGKEQPLQEKDIRASEEGKGIDASAGKQAGDTGGNNTAETANKGGRTEKKPNVSPLVITETPGTWRHQDTTDFYNQYVKANEKLFRNTFIYDPIMKLLNELDQYGDCPSIVGFTFETEFEDLKTLYDILRTIKLREHALNTTRQLIAYSQNVEGRDKGLSNGKMILTGLAHDIGKIPRMRADIKKYNSMDHAHISWNYLKAILNPDLSYAAEVLDAVRDHHLKQWQIKAPWTRALQIADRAARERELMQAGNEGSVPFLEVLNRLDEENGDGKKRKKGRVPQEMDISWFDIDDLLKWLEPQINSRDTTKPQTFSMRDGIVYVMTARLSHRVFEEAEKKGINEVIANAASKDFRRDIELSVTNQLRKRGFIPGYVKPTYVGGNHQLLGKDGELARGLYTPIRFEAFAKELSELEDRKLKAHDLQKIKSVKPLFGDGC